MTTAEPRLRSTRRAARLVVDACVRDRHVVKPGSPWVCQRCRDLAEQVLLICEDDEAFAEYLAAASPNDSEALT